MAEQIPAMKRRVTEAEVRLGYEIFLDQFAVESSTIAKRVGADPIKFVQLLLQQSRFRTNVLDRLNAGSASLGGALGRSVRPDELAVLAELLNLPALNDLFDIGPVPKDIFFGRLLTWQPFLNALDESCRAAIALKRQATPLSARRVVGALDPLYGIEITGWARNEAAPDEAVTIEFVVNGALIGSAVCSQHRREFAGPGDGRPDIGFSFTLPADIEFRAHGADFWLLARDAISKQPIAPPVLMRAPAARSQSSLLELRRQIATMAEELERLSRLLPRLARQSSVLLSEYHLHRESWTRPTHEQTEELRTAISNLVERPRFSLILLGSVLQAGPADKLLRSLDRSLWTDWELIVVGDDPMISNENGELARRLPVTLQKGTIERFKFVSCNGERAHRIAAGLEAASGKIVGFLNAEERLSEDCLARIAIQQQVHGSLLLYTDSEAYDGSEHLQAYNPVFRSGPDRDLLLQTDYIGLYFADRSLLMSCLKQGLQEGELQRYEIALRLLAGLEDGQIAHLPSILYADDNASTAKDASARARVVQSHLDRISPDQAVIREPAERGAGLDMLRIDWQLPTPAPPVSIIIPTRDKIDLLRPCVDSILSTAFAYSGEIEIIIVDNQSREAQTAAYLNDLSVKGYARVLRHDHAFNWSRINNMAAAEASGDVLVFLNNDVVITSSGWLQELVSQALRPEVGAVGPKLLFGDGSIQHAGVLGGVGGIAVHDGLGCRGDDPGYLNRYEAVHGSIAVTGACLCIRASLFEAIGGYDEERFAVAFNDLDLCLRLRDAGYRVIFTPHALLFHFESQSRGLDDTPEKRAHNQREREAFLSRWGDLTYRDSFYNPNFDRTSLPFSVIRPYDP